jgi:5-(carboxyamino)imidazole ribonucleotide mutase
MDKKSVLIVMGSKSDLPVVKPAFKVLDDLGVPYRVTVASAHRSPERAAATARNARTEGVGVIIAAAGGAHHLGGAMAANTTLPVIALPIAVGSLGGMDALLSAVQMPGGVPIASVGVNGAKNAALIAASVLGSCDGELADRLGAQREDQRRKVEQADADMRAELDESS